MSCISVVRLGPTDDNVCAGMLRNAILDYFAKQPQPSTADVITTSSNDTFRVSNKYFDAQISLRGIGQDSSKDNDATTTTTDEAAILPPPKEDGIILVFDAAKSNPDLVVEQAAPSSFGSLGMIHEKATQQGAGDLLRLCVGVSVGQRDAAELRGQAYEAEYARRIHWCLDGGYEYVECDLSPEGLTRGHDERDKEGFARVIEAIAGTMWSSAVMNKNKKTALKKSYESEAAQVAEQQQGEYNEYVPPDPSLLLGSSDNDEAREERARQALLAQSGIDTNPDGQADELSGEENVNPAHNQQQREREQERMFDNLESALRQATSIREMSRTNDLSDDDRRKRAGDAANLLMTLMQQVGMDDEESSENEEE